MDQLAMLLNALTIYSHACHNLVSGQSFLPDHGLFAEIYEYSDGAYDSVIERCIGKGIEINIPQINLRAATICSQYEIGSTASEMFVGVSQIIEQIIAIIESLVDSVSVGTEQLIGDIANAFEGFQYKIKQRLS